MIFSVKCSYFHSKFLPMFYLLRLALISFSLFFTAAVFAGEVRETLVDRPDRLAAAIAEAEPGDHIVLRNGEWRDLRLIFDAEGTTEAPIVLRAQTPGMVRLTGSSVLRLGGEHLEVQGLVFTDGYTDGETIIEFRNGPDRHARHVRLTDCAIIGYNPPERTTRYAWVRLYGQHNRIDHCLFRDHDHSGVTIQVMLDGHPNEHLVEYNYFLNRPPGNANGFEVIQVGQSHDSLSVSRMTVQHNLFEACDGEIEVISNKSGENVYRHNTFLRSQGTLTLRHGNDSVAEYNVFLGEGIPDSGGIRIVGERHQVRHNYFHGISGRTGGVIAIYTGIPNPPLTGYVAADDLILESNTIVASGSNAISLSAGYGRNQRTILPERMQIQSNLIQLDEQYGHAVLTGLLGEGTYFANNYYHEASEIGNAAEGMNIVRMQFKESPHGLRYPVLPDDWKIEEGQQPFTDMDALKVLTPSDVGPSWFKSSPASAPGALLLNSERIEQTRFAFLNKDPEVMEASRALLERAEEILAKGVRYSVTFNESAPASGNAHDYYSTGPYWWPNPDTEDGLPYVRRDGEFNPERDKVSDRDPLHNMVNNVQTLAFAWQLTGDDRYTEWAAELVKVWFLNPDTHMRPNLNHAQAIPGRVTGRGTGIIDTHVFGYLVDALLLMEGSPNWTFKDQQKMRDWMNEFLDWLLAHPYGHHEQNARNNHGTAFDLQVISLALYAGRKELARMIYETYTFERIQSQIDDNGVQTHEVARTRSWSYTTENMRHFFRLILLSRHLDEDWLLGNQNALQRIHSALEYALPFVCDREPWAYEQVTAWQEEYIEEVLIIAKEIFPQQRERLQKALSCIEQKTDSLFLKFIQPMGL